MSEIVEINERNYTRYQDVMLNKHHFTSVTMFLSLDKKVRQGLDDWINTNCSGFIFRYGLTYYFWEKEEAMHFKLVFGGK